MKQERDRAVLRGENVILDGTLANERKAFETLRMLQENGYAVDLVVVDGPKAVTQARAEYRWRTEYLASLKPDATEMERLRGHAVPPGDVGRGKRRGSGERQRKAGHRDVLDHGQFLSPGLR